MSASMLRQLLEEAKTAIKEERYESALESSRRVTQFDPNNFQAFVCVGKSHFHLRHFDDCESAYRRAAELQPAMPFAWKGLLDLFQAQNQLEKKVEPLEQLVTILKKTNKPRAYHKMLLELAQTTKQLVQFPKSLDAFHTLLKESEAGGVSDELPTIHQLWLEVMEIVTNTDQPVDFSLCQTTKCSWKQLTSQFLECFATKDDGIITTTTTTATTTAAATTTTDDDHDHERLARILNAIMQQSLVHRNLRLGELDERNKSILKWFPSAKLCCEMLLLRSEDDDSPIDAEYKAQLLETLRHNHPTSAFVGVFDALQLVEAGGRQLDQARMVLEKLVLQTNVSQFQQMQQPQETVVVGVDSLVSGYRTLVEIELQREPKRVHARHALVLLDKAIHAANDKKTRFGCTVHPKLFGVAIQKWLQASAFESLGDSAAALASYLVVLEQRNADNMTAQDLQVQVKTLENCVELLLSSGQPEQATSQFELFVKTHRDWIDQLTPHPAIKNYLDGCLACLDGWIHLQIPPESNHLLLQHAQQQMETGLALLAQVDPSVSSSTANSGELTAKEIKLKRALYMKRLAMVYWRLNGSFREQKQFCLQQLLTSAKLNPVNDPETFVWLGKWYFGVAKDVVRAEKCFLKALEMDLTCDLAAKELSDLYETLGRVELVVKLWQETIARAQARDKDISWAHLKLAQHQLTLGDEAAIGNLHQVVRRAPRNSRHWVALGHAYQVFDKQQSAYKAYLQAMELGETSWCMLCQVAEIEGQLTLYDQALERMQQVQQVTDPGVNRVVVSVLHGQLLLAQAKSLCGEGLYGRAASNLQRASELIKHAEDKEHSLGQILRLKLLGDVHAFAFYLSPEDFGADQWLNFLEISYEAYQQALKGLSKIQQQYSSNSAEQDFQPLKSQLLYDAALSCWYQIQANCCVNGKVYSAFGGGGESTELTPSLVLLKRQAQELMMQSLHVDASNALAWNGLGIVHDHKIVKQFAWMRAIQHANLDAAWANLGFMYLHNHKKQLAQKAFYQLQSVNAHNVAMWTGYGLLMQQNQMVLESVEAFTCALENAFELDALFGLAANVLVAQARGLLNGNDNRYVADACFAIQKFVERNPLYPQAHYLLGKFQMAKEMIRPAMESFRTSLELTVNSKRNDKQRTLLTRVLRTNYLVALLKLKTRDTLSQHELQQLAGDDDLTLKCFVQIAEEQWSSAMETLQLLKAKPQNSDLFDSLTATQLQVLECLIWYHMGDTNKPLGLLKGLLLNAEKHDDKENHEMVLVALTSLCLVHLSSEEPDNKHLILKAAVKVATSCPRSDRNCTTMESNLQLLLLEALEMVSDKDKSQMNHYAAQIHINPTNTFAYSQLGFSLMSAGNVNLVLKCQKLAEKLAFDQTSVLGAERDGMVQAATLSAFGGLLSGSSATTSAVKLLRMEPRSIWAQLLLAAHLLKQSTYETASPRSHLVGTAIDLLKAENERDTAFSVVVRRNLLLCHGLVLQGQSKEAEAIGTQTIDSIEEAEGKDPTLQQEFQLIKARFLVMIRPREAIDAYKTALKIGSMDTALVIKELAALYECQGFVQHAVILWQILAKKASAQEDKFFSNVRLAVLNGLLNRQKVASRHAKTAVELSTSHPAQHKVALFLQSLF